jgi:hypothetical protein
MRPWIENIFNNSQSYADFLTWFAEIEQTLFHRMQKKLIEGDAHSATGIAFELRTYQTIVNKFNVEASNHRKQLERREQNA